MRAIVTARLLQAGLLILIVLMGLRLVKESAPSELLLLTGLEGSTEYEIGTRYADYLSSRGVRATVVATASSFENLRRLAAEDQPAVGFAISAAGHPGVGQGASADLVALASLYIEPLWLFARNGVTSRQLLDERDGQLSIGVAGELAPLAKLVLDARGGIDDIVMVELDGAPSSTLDATLDQDELDGIFVLGGIDSKIVTRLFSADGFSPISFERAAAYVRRHRFLVDVDLPAGSFDLARNLPRTDLTLLAATVQLVAPADVHPAIVDLLLEAAREIHREPTFFSDRGEYPSMKHVSLPLDEAAIRFFEEGPPRLRKLLPYWASTLVDRFAGFAAAVLGAAMGILSVLPRLLGIPMQIKLHAWFAEVVSIEQESMAGGDIEALIDRLDALDRASADIHVFRFQFTGFLEYRQHIFDTRDRLRLRLAGDRRETSDATST